MSTRRTENHIMMLPERRNRNVVLDAKNKDETFMLPEAVRTVENQLRYHIRISLPRTCLNGTLSDHPNVRDHLLVY